MKNLLFVSLLFIGVAASGQKVKSLIEKGDLEGLKSYEAKGGDIYNYFDLYYYHESDETDGWELMYPMAYAVAKGEPDIVEYYIAQRSNPDEAGWWDDALAQAFIVALSLKDEAMANRLYELGPNPAYRCVSCHDHNALMVAVVYDLEDWYFKLKPASDLTMVSSNGNNLLHLAAMSSSHRVFEDVLSSGLFDVNSRNNSEETPLDYAAQAGNADFFHHLIASGANLFEDDRIWLSVAYSGNMEIFNYLKEHGNPADLYYGDEWLNTALSTALAENDSIMVVALVDHTMAYSKEYTGTSQSYDFMDTYVFWDADINPVLWAIWDKNKTSYEAYLRLAGDANKVMSGHYIPIGKFETKEAKKAFGKEYVEEMYAKYGIVEEGEEINPGE